MVLTLLVCILLAGCFGWGTDAPAEGEDDETNESNREEGNESPPPEDGGEDEPAEEYAGPDEIRVKGVTHMETENGLDHDEITLSNTNDELPLPIGGWEVETDNQDQRISIEEGVVIEPGGTYTVQSQEGERS